jgi:hypothetical protein
MMIVRDNNSNGSNTAGGPRQPLHLQGYYCTTTIYCRSNHEQVPDSCRVIHETTRPDTTVEQPLGPIFAVQVVTGHFVGECCRCHLMGPPLLTLLGSAVLHLVLALVCTHSQICQ